jgi:ppGpp synthetase/RelA/SpoT-type nucleotidyltranferase
MAANDLIVKKYDRKLKHYIRFCERIRFILEDILIKEGLYINSINSRVKSKKSLIKKINRPDAVYKDLSDITDVAGLRVTTYFSEDVDRVSEIVKRKFIVDTENSIDKREIKDPDRFGYLSLHYVVSLSTSDMTGTDCRFLKDLKAEIQIRSILQHAWAEIEHDLGYKSKYSIPFEMRRRFSRLSGLLELADEEFNNLRSELRKYKAKIEDSEYVDKYIDKISLINFIERSDLVKSIDMDISERTGLELEHEEWFIESLVEKLKYAGIIDFEKLMINLGRLSEIVKKLAEEHLKGRSSYSAISKGVCIYYFCTVYLAETGDIEKMKGYLRKFRLGSNESREKFALKIIEKFKFVSEETAAGE